MSTALGYQTPELIQADLDERAAYRAELLRWLTPNQRDILAAIESAPPIPRGRRPGSGRRKPALPTSIQEKLSHEP